MTSGSLHWTGFAAVALCALLAALLACAAADCGFQPDCRPGETYRLAIPCEGKCPNYMQCTDGVAAEKRCGKFFFTTQKMFDPVSLDCVRDPVDCDWWKKLSTTTPAATTVSTTPADPTTTPSTSTTETTPSTSTEASSTTTAAPDTTAAPSSTTPTPSSSSPPPPPEPSPTESAAAPLAAAWPLLAAAAALIL